MSKLIYPLMLVSAYAVVISIAYGNYTKQEKKKEAIKLLINDAAFIIGDKDEYPNHLNRETTLLSIDYKRMVITSHYHTTQNVNHFNSDQLVTESKDFLGVTHLCKRKEYEVIPVSLIYKVHFEEENRHIRFKRTLKELC